MQKVALPKKIEYQKDSELNRGKIIIEPCFPGYGTTLGNSLRRVLLSSLPGAAVIGIKIEGVNHEFMTLPNLKEDILEFILNLKQLRLKVFSEEIIKLDLEVHGKKEVKASDIKKNSQVEIANTDLVLGNITDMAGNMKAEIYVSQGMGYEIVENREKKDKEIGYIEMDSIFSPIVSVGIKVDNVRVGKFTNYEKLILDIKTDGTITPEEAYSQALEILNNQFKSLEIGKDTEKSEEKINEEEETEKVKVDDKKSEVKIDEEKEEVGKKEKKRGRPKKS